MTRIVEPSEPWPACDYPSLVHRDMVEIQVRLVSFIAFYNIEISCFAPFLLAPSIQSLRSQELRWRSCWSLLAFETRWVRPKTDLPAPSYSVFPGSTTSSFYDADCGYLENITADALDRTSRQMLDIMLSIVTLAANEGVEVIGAHRTAHGPLLPCGDNRPTSG